MSAPTFDQARAAHVREEDRRPLAERTIAQYRRGLLTLAELIADLQRIPLDEVGWETPGAMFPDVTADQYARLTRGLPGYAA